MDIRTKIEEHRGLALIVAIVAIAAGLGYIVFQVKANSTTFSDAYFTTDDGKTWFADDNLKVPPFQKDGVEAVRARVYKTAKGTTFVAFMEKYPPAIKKQLETNMANHVPSPELADPNFLLIKRPGAGNKWLGMRDPGYLEARDVKCPDGSTDADMVVP